MSTRPAEATQVHTRLLKCALEVEDARAFWAHWRPDSPTEAQTAFDEYWFGARSLARVKVLLTNFRARFEVAPQALGVLACWPHMEPETRQLICHWHLQFADPLYRAFTGEYLVDRLARGRDQVTRERVIGWVGDQGPGRWTMSTRIQFASKLLSSAYPAGLLGGNRDPRAIVLPRVRDDALAYLMYFLRGADFEGSLLDNPYTASVGLDGRLLEERLADLPGLTLRRQGDLLDFAWAWPDLAVWGEARFGTPTLKEAPA